MNQTQPRKKQTIQNTAKHGTKW